MFKNEITKGTVCYLTPDLIEKKTEAFLMLCGVFFTSILSILKFNKLQFDLFEAEQLLQRC